MNSFLSQIICSFKVKRSFTGPSTWEAEALEFLSSKPAWSTDPVPGQPTLSRDRETLSRKKIKIKKRQKRCNNVIL